MERSETSFGEASSFVGGETVGTDAKRRIYGFSFPFGASARPKPAAQPAVGHGPAAAPLAWDADHNMAQEHESCQAGFVVPKQSPTSSKSRSKSASAGLARSQIPDIDGTVVVLGGYRGSTLRDTKSGRLVWMRPRPFSKASKPDLELGLDDEDEMYAADSVYADSMVTHVGPIDISKKFIRRLQKQKNCRVFDWGYDWRLSCTNNSRKFGDYIKKLVMHDQRGVIVVAHSMGGLVAHHALQHFIETNQKMIRGMVYLGVPSQCPSVMGTLRQNEMDTLSPRTNFSMRSSFVFLPEDQRLYFSRDLAKCYEVDFWDAESWQKHRLSAHLAPEPKSSGKAPLDPEAAQQYLKRTLLRVREFRNELAPLPNKKYPPMVAVYGNTLPTAIGARVESEQHIATTRYDEPVFGCGDGVVFRKNIVPMDVGFTPSEHNVKIIATPDGHVGLLSNLEVLGEALAHILRAEGTEPTYGFIKKKRFAGARELAKGTVGQPWKSARALFKRKDSSTVSTPASTAASTAASTVTSTLVAPPTPEDSLISDSDSELDE